ncbi:hypothetical protein L210DRAFT_3618016 [Boletus edulis BED1]|uniref:Membrane anchor Opy2 N-terminal domain-containing protein n=1 Tax=Boletus edulis BED1 TaxID=1328754 RepID=A0AAD4C6U1_BOLED|nr:hypothetical protein L210DRAFT_3618016 [Boletus edulis BED1]
MHMDLFNRQCVSCPSQPPVCTCSADETCILISQSCNACQSGSSNGGGISSVAVLLVLIGSLLVFFLYRRRQRARQSHDAAVEPKQDVPAPAAAVLNRPDPTEKPQPTLATPATPTTPTNAVRVYSSTGESVIDLDLRSHGSRTSGGQSPNPFDDGQSIQTTSTTTNGTNVIPIALVSSSGSVQASSPRSSGIFPPNSPVRPARPSDLVLDSARGSLDTLPKPSPHYTQSQRSGVSRASYGSNASYSSDFLNEAPMIVTHAQGAVRQVVGKVRAEVIQTSGTVTPASHLSSDSLKPPSVISRPSVRSPLAATSFGPADIVNEADEEHQLSPRSDPFGDHHAPSKQASIASFESRAGPKSDELALPPRPRSAADNVNAGLLSARSDQKSPHGIPSPKLIPPSPALSGTLQEQQQRALAYAQAQACAQGLDKSKRMSGTSMVSTTSTRADSILESFPFVPPSPIASRPVRSPPRSPLGQQSSVATQLLAPLAVAECAPPPPTSGTTEVETSLPPLDPPNRRILGMSTGSQLSTASSGLGNFPFQIDHGGTETTHPPSALRQRASLDTLALMSDLSSYPLGYDRDDHESLPPPPKS